jgi:hypothetical protein
MTSPKKGEIRRISLGQPAYQMGKPSRDNNLLEKQNIGTRGETYSSARP